MTSKASDKQLRFYIRVTRITFVATLLIEVTLKLLYRMTRREEWILYLFLFFIGSFVFSLLLFIHNIAMDCIDRESQKALSYNSLLLLVNMALPFLLPLIF